MWGIGGLSEGLAGEAGSWAQSLGGWGGERSSLGSRAAGAGRGPLGSPTEVSLPPPCHSGQRRAGSVRQAELARVNLLALRPRGLWGGGRPTCAQHGLWAPVSSWALLTADGIVGLL